MVHIMSFYFFFLSERSGRRLQRAARSALYKITAIPSVYPPDLLLLAPKKSGRKSGKNVVLRTGNEFFFYEVPLLC